MRTALVVFALLALATSLPEQSRRRRIKKKILRAEEAEPEATEVAVVTKDKTGRGFLDEYYSKFEERTVRVPEQLAGAGLPSSTFTQSAFANQVVGGGGDQLGAGSTYQPAYASPATDLAVGSAYPHQAYSNSLHQQQMPPMQAETPAYVAPAPSALLPSTSPTAAFGPASGSPGALLESQRRSDLTDVKLQKLMSQEKQLLELLSRENELSAAEKEQLLNQLEIWEQHRRMLEQEKERLKGVSDRNEKSGPLLPSPYQGGYLAEVIPTSLAAEAAYEQADLDDEADTRSTSYSSSSSHGVTKYFGLTGTTSHDIQLGLTFTVPFLSIPLNSINSILGGNFGDIGNLLDFTQIDTTSIITFVVIALASVFILPQAIYWLTGINLPTFNWGRSDDVDGSGMVALANTVDAALQEFSIDSRGCLAKSICTALYDKEAEGQSFLLKTIAKSAVSNPAVQGFLGATESGKLAEAERAGSGLQCEQYFKGNCPWEPAAVTTIIMKLMESQGTSIADLALKAMSAAAS